MSFVARLLALALFSTPAFASTVRLTTADRVAISAQIEGSGERGVVLVHGHGEDHSVMAELVKSFEAAKMKVIAIDLRGHGASRGTVDPLKGVQDINAAIAYLRKRGLKKVALVGAELGGNLSFVAAAQDADVESVVIISPALNHNGVKASAALADYGARPILMVVSGNDPLGLKAANMLDDRLENSTVEVLDVDGSGSKLVQRAPDLPGMIVEWLTANDLANGEKKPDLTTENEALETSGTKLGER